jgi:cytochrome d ubiquinol oxidase subunit II
VAFSVAITWATFRVQPHVLESFRDRPYGWALPLLAISGLAAVRWFLREGSSSLSAFLASCAYLLGMLTSVVFGVYPYVLPSSTNPAYALTIYNASAATYGLRIGVIWWTIGMALATGYFTFLYRHFFGRAAAESESDTY